ncbi:MAG: hypothetical protein ABH883_07635 [Candidatus Omnitrophota bacterium]
METLKNFLAGVAVTVMSLIIIGVTFLTWPILIGISSILLSIIAFVLFFILVFYIIVLIGHIARKIVSRS